MADNRRVEGKELLVLASAEPEAGERYDKNGFRLRVCQWLYEKRDGSVGGSVKLERRQFYLKDGEAKIGKAEGLTLDDLKLLQDNWKKVVEIMKNPPEPAWPEKKPEPAQGQQQPGTDTDISEIPF